MDANILIVKTDPKSGDSIVLEVIPFEKYQDLIESNQRCNAYSLIERCVVFMVLSGDGGYKAGEPICSFEAFIMESRSCYDSGKWCSRR